MSVFLSISLLLSPPTLIQTFYEPFVKYLMPTWLMVFLSIRSVISIELKHAHPNCEILSPTISPL